MSAHEFLQRASDRLPKTSFGETILQMPAYPLKEGLSKDLQFFTPNESGLIGEPLKLRRRQVMSNRRINLIGFLVAEWVCLVAVGHLAKFLRSLNALAAAHLIACVKSSHSKVHAKGGVHRVMRWGIPIPLKGGIFHVFYKLP